MKKVLETKKTAEANLLAAAKKRPPSAAKPTRRGCGEIEAAKIEVPALIPLGIFNVGADRYC
ncbi:MAG: hypothetical protein SGI77_01100 [Pirellulaceae bacterium]|nr:hypothetical protein [Pirellulaceae bacterium]